jgi:hypothetical protein
MLGVRIHKLKNLWNLLELPLEILQESLTYNAEAEFQ